MTDSKWALVVDKTVRQLFDDEPELHEGLDVRDVSDVKGIEEGWVATGKGFKAPPPPEVVIPIVPVSDRQFFQALATKGLISQDEALAAVQTGAVPKAMEAFIDALPATQQFGAKMLLCGATTFDRSNPLVDAFGEKQGLDAAALDDLWRFAAAL